MRDEYKDLLKNRIAAHLNSSMYSTLTAQELAYRAGITETTDTCPITRGLIREMINEGHLIGSNSRGYHIMTSGKEVQQCLNSLLKRTMGINKRIQSIYDAAKAKGIL